METPQKNPISVEAQREEAEKYKTEVESKAEYQHQKAGAAHSALVMEILAFAVNDGETMSKLQRAMDPQVSYQRELNERLQRLQDEAARIRREKKRRKKCRQGRD